MDWYVFSYANAHGQSGGGQAVTPYEQRNRYKENDPYNGTNLDTKKLYSKEIVNTAKQYTFGAGIATTMVGAAADLTRAQTHAYAAKKGMEMAIQDRILMKTISKSTYRVAQIFTGIDIGLSALQYSISDRGLSDKARLGINLSIGIIGLSKDPYVGGTAMILGIAETAGAFDRLYDTFKECDPIPKNPYPNAFGLIRRR